MKHPLSTSLAAVIGGLLALPAVADDYGFTILNAPGAISTQPVTISDSGQVVGSYHDATSFYSHGFVESGGSFTTLDAPGAFSTSADSINAIGQVVGHYLDANFYSHGFVESGGSFTILNVPGAANTVANSINASGQVAGEYGQVVGTYVGPSGGHTTFFSNGFVESGGVFTTISLPSGVTGIEVNGINDSGQVVGTYEDATGNPHGFVYSGGVFTTLAPPGATLSGAEQINASGQVAGQYLDASGIHSFVESGGAFTILNAPGAISTLAESINASGQVAGEYDDATGIYGFVESGGAFTTISLPSGTTNIAVNSINDSGQVTGSVGNSSGIYGFVASPAGSIQSLPVLPIGPCDPSLLASMCFTNVHSGQWFDPPITSTINYVMDSAALFTDIADFPTGFNSPFTVSSDGNILGTFGPGQSLIFPGSGVSEFTISGISPAADLANGDAFPLKLDFSQPTASFYMSAASVPEPATWLLFTAGLGIIIGFRNRKMA